MTICKRTSMRSVKPFALVGPLALVLFLCIHTTAVAQYVTVDATTGQTVIRTEVPGERTTYVETATMNEYFGQDASIMEGLLDIAVERAPDERFAWSKKFQKGGWSDNSCAAAAENFIDTSLAQGAVPDGWQVRQIGTLGNLTTFENSFAQEAEFVINWWANGELSPTDFDALNPPSYAHSLSVVKSPDGNYYTVDNWGDEVEVKRVYPVDADGTYFSTDPNETNAGNAAYRLSGLDTRGRPWDQTDEEAESQPEEQFESQPPSTSEPVEVEVLTSADPNDKTGLLGVGEQRFITPDERIFYVIRFENMADASAPAQEVLIRDTLDTETLDLSSFELDDITFGSEVVDVPPGRTQFFTRVSLNDPFELLIAADLNKETGIVTWRFTTLDTNTGDLPFDPLDGFLPPNMTSPEGEGSVSFSIGIRDDLAGNEVIRNQARIIFDLNEPIDTPPWVNTLDTGAPSSSVNAIIPHPSDSMFTVQWSGNDAGSGVRQFDVYFSVNDSPFIRWLTGTYDTARSFVGRDGNTYGFYSIAYDATGNVEPAKSVAERSTAIRVSTEDPVDPALPQAFTLESAYPNPFSEQTTIRFGVSEPSDVSLVVYDIQGREVSRPLYGATLGSGWHETEIDGRRLPSGVYHYRLQAGSRSLVGQFVIAR